MNVCVGQQRFLVIRSKQKWANATQGITKINCDINHWIIGPRLLPRGSTGSANAKEEYEKSFFANIVNLILQPQAVGIRFRITGYEVLGHDFCMLLP